MKICIDDGSTNIKLAWTESGERRNAISPNSFKSEWSAPFGGTQPANYMLDGVRYGFDPVSDRFVQMNELQDVLDRCPSPKKIGFYTIGDKSIYLYDLRRMDEIMEALDNRSSMDWCVAVHDMNAGFDEKILFPSSVESTAG